MADLSKSAQHLVEALVLGTDTPVGSSVISAGTITATIPTAAANVTTVVNATVTGAKLGDIVLISGPTVQLLHQSAPRAQVTATDTIELSASADGTGFTGASKVYNYILFRQSA